MVSNPVTFQSNTPIEDVILEMAEKKIGSIWVTDEKGELQGIFTVTDALDVLVEILRGRK
ncbi:CBS domain-containing protein, partial [Nitrosospira sp. NpAV]|uniref:CBS domain-containing protein n=1 Tax=Nitrosospira sp. NpAV TaxID=58133 RepID=UPI0005A224A1